jgi:hypothetical protein
VVDAAMEETDDQCIARAARVYRDSLVAYSRLGRAAADEEDSATIRLDADFWTSSEDVASRRGARRSSPSG